MNHEKPPANARLRRYWWVLMGLTYVATAAVLWMIFVAENYSAARSIALVGFVVWILFGLYVRRARDTDSDIGRQE